MGRGESRRGTSTTDGARHGGHPPAPLREAELPVRKRRESARVGGAELLAGGEDEVLDAAGRRGGGGPRGHGTVQGREGPPGLPSRRGAQRAGDPAAAGQDQLSGEESAGEPAGEPAGESAGGSARFAASEQLFGGLVGFLSGAAAAGLTHEELEARLASEGRELHRQLLQDHLDLRADRETRLGRVTDAEGRTRSAVEVGHQRALTTVFGTVQVSRLAYRRKGSTNLHPADAALNLPAERHSHGLRASAAVEATRGSYAEAAAAITRATGVGLGKRQVEALAARAAVDFQAFYAQRSAPAAQASDVLVISADGKGIVMRPDALRPATAKAATHTSTKLATRLSKGEKRNRKRMAELAAVYDLSPVPRSPADILTTGEHTGPPPTAPVATNKWITASVVDDAASVITAAFTEAERRDPDHARRWVALVDGNNHQIDRIRSEAKARGVTVTILIDFIHVLEYLWGAAWCFHHEGDRAAEDWVREKALAVLAGHAGLVAAAIRRKATCRRLDPAARAKADTCANYLHRKRRYLDYPTALAAGWPIATGIIEGACRHLVHDRMDVTGARWRLTGAEAILKLRAIRANGDWTDYWHYHLTQERQRVHESRYAASLIPPAQAA
jgi:hypothetical protein